MSIYCQRCHKATAIVHVTELKEGEKIELHLCEECAESQGIPPKIPPATMLEIFQQLVEKSSTSTTGRDRRCPKCGMTFNEFKAKGRFGCPDDYNVFQRRVVPLLERIHGGSEHHGESEEEPVPSPASSPEQDELRQLRHELQQVVAREEYEEAARLRDRIQLLETKLAGEGDSGGDG